jgi:hypothetical protein
MLGSGRNTEWGVEEHGQFPVWQVGKLCKRFTFGTDNAHHHGIGNIAGLSVAMVVYGFDFTKLWDLTTFYAPHGENQYLTPALTLSASHDAFTILQHARKFPCSQSVTDMTPLLLRQPQ